MASVAELITLIRELEEAADSEEAEQALAEAKRLIEADPALVNATAPPDFPYPPLAEAVPAVECPELVQLLLDHGADPNARLTHTGPGLFQGELNPGATPLHAAAAYRAMEAAEILLEHGADANARDDEGWPPLFYAGSVWTGDREAPVAVIEALLDHGADLHATDRAGRTVMDVAGNNDSALAEYLADDYGLPLPLAAALNLGRVERAREVLGDPAYQLPADRGGRLLLLQAVMGLYQYSLFEPGAPGPSDHSLTPEQAAAVRRRIGDHLDLLQGLLDRGVLDGDRGAAGGTLMDVLSDHPGEPPIGYRALCEAVGLASTEPAELLIRRGVRPGSFVQAMELRRCIPMHPLARSDMLAMLARHGITEEPPPEFHREVRELAERIRSPEGTDRLAAVRRLRGLSAVGAGPHLADAAPTLRELLNDPSEEVRGLAAATLECITPREGDT